LTPIASTKLPEVSIIVPTRDRYDLLPRTLVAALAQRDVDTEVIVVDDGSRVPVAQRLTRAGSGRIRVIRHESSLGVANARNAGVAAARGEWLAFLDDDDLWEPAKLRRQLDASAAAGLDYAFTGGLGFDSQRRMRYVEDAPESGADVHRMLLARNIVPAGCSNVIARTALVRRLGGFDPTFSILADWDLHVRLSAEGPAATVPDPLVAYALHETNMHLAEASSLTELQRFDSKHGLERRRLGVSLDRAWWLRGRVDSRRRAGDHRGAGVALCQLGRLTREPGLVARGVVLWLGGERAMTAARVLRPGWTELHDERPPRWLLNALNPPRPDVQAIWQA
jgi:glycosyltransferase involved in cell wall biosynthesis